MRGKMILLSCLLLSFALALPVQGQQTPAPTPVPTLPTSLTNPITMAPCGLPASWAQFTSSATVKTFNMTADCVFSRWAVNNSSSFLSFSANAGEFTINGNGYSIIGPSNARVFYVFQGVTLNLNDIVFRETGFHIELSLGFLSYGRGLLASGGRINGSNLIFRDASGNGLLAAIQGGEIHLENAQFLNGRGIGLGTGARPSLIATGPMGLISITNSVFRGNTGYEALVNSQGTVQLQGSLTLADNSVSYSSPYLTIGDGVVMVPPPPPKPKKKDVPTLTPTATPRPPAVTCPGLSQATGIAVHATYGLTSGVQCQRLDGAGIGIQSLVDAGFIDAVDIWGYVDQGIEVCFPQVGRVVFLDARTMPRAITPLASAVANGQTCAAIDSPGSLVLLPPE